MRRTWAERLADWIKDNPETAKRREDALAELSPYERSMMEKYEEDEDKVYTGYYKNMRGRKIGQWAGVPE